MGMRLSACIIARDEERVLARCLRSLRGACDEVCVVDTGSRDRTAELARDHGARVQRFTACNDRRGRMIDFAAARNASLAMARGTWALWIDADEVLQPGGAERLAVHCASRGYGAVEVGLESGRSTWPAVRLFRRAGVQFTGIVHEWPLVRGALRTDAAIVIRNRPDKRGKESAIERDLRLCRRGLRADPHDARMRLYLARALHRDGAWRKAAAAFRRYAADAPDFRAGVHYAWNAIADCALAERRWRPALAAARRAIAVDPDRAESHCAEGDARLALGDVDGAARAFRRALACARPADDYPMFTDWRWYRAYPRDRLRALDVRR